MPDVSKRAPRRQDISSTLKVCPYCLGDLELTGAAGSGYYACLQCGARSHQERAGRRTSWQWRSVANPLMTPEALFNRTPF